ncbi:MAG: hypothetical protein Q8R30_00690 [bacterium]|nr:hypothetical protein [bacterium]
MHFLYSLTDKMHQLPERNRRILALSTLIGGGAIIAAIVWMTASPLHDLNTRDEESSLTGQTAQHSEGKNLPAAGSIPDIGPIIGFLDSFKAAKNLLIPKELGVAKLDSASSSWSQFLSPAYLGTWIKQLPGFIIRETKTLAITILQNTISLLSSILDKVVASTSRVSQ